MDIKQPLLHRMNILDFAEAFVKENPGFFRRGVQLLLGWEILTADR